jgi:hypothetical protein
VVGGTPDGLALAPYVRSSRRLRAEFTVLEQHIAYPLRPDGPEIFSDSVGVGCYRIDLHPQAKIRELVPELKRRAARTNELLLGLLKQQSTSDAS